ncbi:MAG TPA: HlyC/CorC family transporter [Alphaproteobacteria bacterium]|nr:HlyC/CorC family transporter [Alphaproteobacteria bacterium]
MTLELIVNIVVIVLLLAISAFFSGAETGLTAASRPRMHALARKGVRRARLVNELRERKEHLITAILIGNNLVNILASALATGALIALFGEAGIAYATIAMTVLVVVFGEVLPKTFAINHADRVALAVAPLARAVAKGLMPVVRVTQAVVRGLLRVFGVGSLQPGGKVSEEELRGAIELHGGADVRDERNMLRSILDLADVEVGTIMVHRRQVLAIDIDQKPAAVVEQALSSKYTRMPLWRGQPDNIVGVLHAKAILQALRTNSGNFDAIRVSEIATPPWFIPESTTLLDQLEAFRRRREHFAIVVDEYGAFLGIVTLEDILEEIVGDIAERHEFQVPGVRPMPDGSYVIDGHVTIRDLNRDLDWQLPVDEAATIAGLVLHEARRIPEVGQVFIFHGFRFEILRRKRNQITSLRVTPPRLAAPQQPIAGEVVS